MPHRLRCKHTHTHTHTCAAARDTCPWELAPCFVGLSLQGQASISTHPALTQVGMPSRDPSALLHILAPLMCTHLHTRAHTVQPARARALHTFGAHACTIHMHACTRSHAQARSRGPAAALTWPPPHRRHLRRPPCPWATTTCCPNLRSCACCGACAWTASRWVRLVCTPETVHQGGCAHQTWRHSMDAPSMNYESRWVSAHTRNSAWCSWCL